MKTNRATELVAYPRTNTSLKAANNIHKHYSFELFKNDTEMKLKYNSWREKKS